MKSFQVFSFKYSFISCRRHIALNYVALIFFISHQFNFASAIYLNNSSINCSQVRQTLQNRGIKLEDIPPKPVNEIFLRYCELSSTGTCCTYNIETNLAIVSKLQFEKSSKELIGKLQSILSTRAQKFNELFTKMLLESKKGFHSMFKRTYGVIYEQNAYVFSDFFDDLQAYFIKGKVNLSETMDSFFNTLYQKLFTVLNSQYTFDDKYLGCISEHMKDLKPFGDVPDKLSVQIKRSFIATKTFAQALTTAADVAKNMIQIRPTTECTESLTKMQQCGLCKGFVEKPCSNYCTNVVKKCLQYNNDLDDEWNNFIVCIEKISERLLGPFNIVMVVEPINIKISEAIMNFQETGQEITNQIFQGCGRPLLGLQKRFVNQNAIVTTETTSLNETIQRYKRSTNYNSLYKIYNIKKRSTDDHNSNTNTPQAQKGKNNNKNRQKTKTKNQKNKSETNKEPILDKLIKDIKQKLKDLKKFWSNLPYQICNNEELISSSETNSLCWNGNSLSTSDDTVLSPHSTTVESPSRQNIIIRNQLYFLKTAINNLHSAYNGQDVEWTDQEEPFYENGSGSGVGATDNEDELGSGSKSIQNTLSNSNNNNKPTSVQVNTITENVPVSGTDFKNTSQDDRTTSKGKSGVTTTKTTKFTSQTTTKTSLQRMLFTYLLPIYVAWFGSITWEIL